MSTLPHSQFHADPARCVACGLCVADCPVHIIYLDGGVAAVRPEGDSDCLRCQHCLAICPTAAVRVAGRDPNASQPVGTCDPAALDALLRSRRSVRQFSDAPVDPALLRRVMETVAYAPTGVNARDLHYTVVHSRAAMDDIRNRTCETLVAQAHRLPESHRWLADWARMWVDDGVDMLFRTAPHLIVATAGPGQACPVPDSVIALAHFELYAQANGIGTTWCGLMQQVLTHLPESREWLGIPAEHSIGYAMLFGMAGVRYQRTAQPVMPEVTIR